MKLAYKLLTAEEYAFFARTGVFAGSAADIRDGFIHLSYSDQLRGTAEKHFAGRGVLRLLALDGAALGEALRDEISRDGKPFPHLYRSLLASDVIWQRDIRPSDVGVPIIPDHLEPEPV